MTEVPSPYGKEEIRRSVIKEAILISNKKNTAQSLPKANSSQYIESLKDSPTTWRKSLLKRDVSTIIIMIRANSILQSMPDIHLSYSRLLASSLPESHVDEVYAS